MNQICPVCRTQVQAGAETCPVCGFHIKGATTEFEPIKVEKDSGKVNAPTNEAVLRVVRGPQVGLEYPLDKDVTTIGRNPNCDIFLNDMTVSREHARIVNQAGSHVLQDEQSYNGVWVNNNNVEAKTLKHGDFIQIGKFGFIYET